MELTEKEAIKWIKEHWEKHEVSEIRLEIVGKGSRETLHLDKRYM